MKPINASDPDLRMHKFKLEMELEGVDQLLFADKSEFDRMPLRAIQLLLISNQDMNMQKKLKLRAYLLTLRNDIRETINFLETRISDYPLIAESDFSGVMSDNKIQNETKEENFVDAVGDPVSFVSAGDSANSSQGQTNILNMSDYLSRPVEIYEVTLSGSTKSIKLSVWDLFTKQPSVRAKVRNYAYLRGNLHVRIAISGTPFHYGRMLVSYQPYAIYNSNLVNLLTMVTTTSSARPLLLNYLSQAPGAVSMNVNENVPVEVICPFISTKPMHRLFNSATTAIAAGTSFDDMTDAGDLYIYTLNTIGAVSTAPADVTMQVYAWMTDVELGTNTATLLAITTEADFSDERKTGPVQRISSRLLDISNALSSVPSIGIFARASSIVLSSVKNLAELFGWSKPVMHLTTSFVKNNPYTNGAQTIGDDTNFRIVLDPKQELTVDPRVIGSTEDDMTIKAIAGRSSLLKTFQWASTDAIMASPIFIARINPCLVTYITSTKNYVQPTALAYAAAPFTFWRGDIIFRFEVVCSQYHRGKFAIFYEPNASQMTLINADLSFNKQFIRVIDIQQTQTFEVRVNWASYRAWLKTNTAAAAPLNTSLSYTGTENQGFCNGYIGIVPFTQLTSPSSTPIVEINVYVRSENLQVNGISTTGMPSERLVLSSLMMAESEFSTGSARSLSSMQGSLSTKEVSTFDLNDSTASAQHICEEHFGEQPISFRALLKRYTTHASYALSSTTSGIKYTQLIGNILPNNNLQYGGSAPTYNDLYSYLRYAYVGIRGGVRFRIRNVGATGVTEMMNAKVSLQPPTTNTTETVSWIATSSTGGPALLEGTVSFVPNTNGGIEVEFPFYTNNLWVFSFVDGLTGGTSTDNMTDYWFRQYLYTVDYASTSTPSAQAILTEFATGEDFSLLRFQGAPFYSANPVA